MSTSDDEKLDRRLKTIFIKPGPNPPKPQQPPPPPGEPSSKSSKRKQIRSEKPTSKTEQCVPNLIKVLPFSYDCYDVIKSPVDESYYKVIQFPNQLRAVLISTLDYTNPDTFSSIDPETCSFEAVRAFNERHAQMYQHLGPDPDDMSLLTKVANFDISVDDIPDSDPPGKTCKEPPLKIQKVERPPKEPSEAHPFGISICITAGSLHDPQEFPGMAHLCEHCVFEGTKKFPASWQLLQENSLHVNAYTGKERTVYYAYTDCFETLKKVIPIFSDMICNPLLSDEVIYREILSVDSESSIRQSDDIIRLFDLFTYIAKPQHPLHRYHAGDAQTLLKPGVYKALRKWHKKYYEPSNMIVSIQGPITITELIRTAGEHFYYIPQSTSDMCESSGSEILKMGYPFQKSTYNRIYKVFPFEDIQWLVISWTIPKDVWRNSETKPLEYIVSLMKRKGQGSLYHHLVGRNWIIDSTCCCTNPSNAYVKTRLYSSIVILFELTEHGFDHTFDILLSLFAYIKKMQRIGPKRRIFDEIRSNRAFNFHFNDDSVNNFTLAGVSLHINEENPSKILTAPALVTKYEPQIIRDCLNHLTPGNMNVMVLSKKFEKDVTQLHPNILTEFGMYYFSENLLQSIDSCLDFHGYFSLPERNLYIQDNVCCPLENTLGNLNVISSASYLHSSGKASITCSHQAVMLGFPATAVYTFMITSTHYPSATAENTVCTQLWAKLLNEKICSRFHDAVEAGIRPGLSVNENGIFVYVFGLSRHLPNIWLGILEEFSEFYVSPQRFGDHRSSEVKAYANNTLNSMTLAQDLVLYITCTRYVLQGQLEAVLKTDVTYESFMQFTQKFKSRMWICCQIFGSVTNEHVQTVAKSIADLKYDTIIPQDVCKNFTNILPVGEKCLRVRAMSPKCYTSFVINYYQLGILKRKDEYPICLLLVKELSNYIFDELRSKQQLGYLVWTLYDECYSVSSLRVWIQFQADRYSPGFIDERIDDTFVTFYQKNIRADSDLLNLVERHHRRNEGRRSSRSLNAVEVPDFLRKFQCDEGRNVDSTIDLYKIREFYLAHFPTESQNPQEPFKPSKGMQKLSVQVVGNQMCDSSEPKRSDIEMSKIKYYDEDRRKSCGGSFPVDENTLKKLEFLSFDLPNKMRVEENGYFLTNLISFKNQLFVYPNYCGDSD